MFSSLGLYLGCRQRVVVFSATRASLEYFGVWLGWLGVAGQQV